MGKADDYAGCDRALPGECVMCACGHCIRYHEKAKWHRDCYGCDPKALDDWSGIIADWDGHRPAGEPRRTCCEGKAEAQIAEELAYPEDKRIATSIAPRIP